MHQKQNVVFWKNMPSHIAIGAIRRLASVWPGEVHCVYDTRILPDRRELGWTPPDHGPIQLHFLDEVADAALFSSNVVREQEDAIHVLGGIRGCRSVQLAWERLKRRPDTRLVCSAERPSWSGRGKAALQSLWYRQFFLRYGSRFRAFLAMGTLGCAAFEALGVNKSILFPFMYQTDGARRNVLPREPIARRSVRIVYIGQFIKRKGVDLLVESLNSLYGMNFCMSWIGGGGEYERLIREMASDSKWQGRVRFLGRIPAIDAVSELSGHDLCIVPSRHDGWAVVVNEALQAGLGVITTSAVGAQELIRVSGAGLVIAPGSADALRVALSSALNQPLLVEEWQQRAHVYSKYLNAEVVGDYLCDILRFSFTDEPTHERPRAPWLEPIIPRTAS